jgi:hypothetical protein
MGTNARETEGEGLIFEIGNYFNIAQYSRGSIARSTLA